MDGVSIAPYVTGGDEAAVKRDAIYWHFPGYLGAGADHWRTMPVGTVRSGDYKLLEFFEDGKVELYNLKDDPGQEHDLAGSKPEVAKELRAKLVAWRESVGAKMPAENKDRKPPGKASKGRKKKAAEDDE